MSLDIEYGVKSDIRNSQVVREVDARQQHELRRILLLALFTLVLVLFAGLQRTRLIKTNVQIENLRLERVEERITNRTLRASVEALESATRIARMADALGMRPAMLADTVVLERTIDTMPVDGILARAR